MRSVIFAPGMHDATVGMSASVAHVTAGGAGIGNVRSIVTFMLVGSALVEPQRVALLPDTVRRVRHIHVRDTEVREGVDDRVREARNAADVRRLRDALRADRMMRRRR